MVGQPAPGFALRALDGGQVQLSQFRGSPVLLNFWASWCPPCRQEMPALVRVSQAHQADGLVILGINLTFQDSVADAEAFVEEFNVTFPVLLDETGEVAMKTYLVRGLPTSVFIDRAGVIRRVHLGAMTEGQIEAFVEEIVAS